MRTHCQALVLNHHTSDACAIIIGRILFHPSKPTRRARAQLRAGSSGNPRDSPKLSICQRVSSTRREPAWGAFVDSPPWPAYILLMGLARLRSWLWQPLFTT